MKHLTSSVTSLAYRVTRTVLDIECDVCHKVIPAKDRNWNDYSGRYFSVTTGHRDWGNDSCDSVKTVDICPDCLPKYVTDYFEETKESSTAYLDIETDVAYPRESSHFLKEPPKEGEIIIEDDRW